MVVGHLRVVAAPEIHSRAAEPATVTMRLRDLFPLLVHAHRHQSTWLRELADDEILVSEELADILDAIAESVDRPRGA